MQLDPAIMQAMNWDDLRFFLALAQASTLVAAARSLGVDATTVGRRLAALETALGAQLFERHPEGLHPTSAGAHLLVRAARIAEEATAAEREIRGADQRAQGSVRVTAGDGLVAMVLTPRLGELLARHPGLDVELRAENRAVDLSRREADLGVRLFRPREPGLVARRLALMPLRLYGSEAYFARRGRPTSARTLARHDFVDYDATLARTPAATWLREELPDARIVLRSNATMTLVAAAVAGLGLVLLPELLGRADARLIPVLPRLELPTRELWLVFHGDLRPHARVQAVSHWLLDVLATPPRLEAQ
jgi:DNA-binding transcriptional LysR family regulator